MIDYYGHLSGAADVFDVLASTQDSSEVTLEFLNTHPDLGERSVQLREQAAALGTTGDTRALPWVAQ